MSRKKQDSIDNSTETETSPESKPFAPAGREPGEDPVAERKFAPDPFGIAGDYEVGVRLLESRRYRRAEITFRDGKPSPEVIEKLKTDGFRWHPQEKIWQRPIGTADGMAVRIEAERTYQAIVEMMRAEKGLPGPDGLAF